MFGLQLCNVKRTAWKSLVHLSVLLQFIKVINPLVFIGASPTNTTQMVLFDTEKRRPDLSHRDSVNGRV